MKILITGGCGFIGSSLVKLFTNSNKNSVLNIDKLTYAANQNNLADIEGQKSYSFIQVDICDKSALSNIFVIMTCCIKVLQNLNLKLYTT